MERRVVTALLVVFAACLAQNAEPQPETKESVPENAPPEREEVASGWEMQLHKFLLWANKEPWAFLYYVLLLLTPFFCISACLSWKLSKELEKQERKRKRKMKAKPPPQKTD